MWTTWCSASWPSPPIKYDAFASHKHHIFTRLLQDCTTLLYCYSVVAYCLVFNSLLCVKSGAISCVL